ncbi:hypothetical protein L1987_09563 [Smallanthus sonchifolius]|uniref:Uncharacterized protein n=1 Tax=Smallanthus sonchifolius TaxID=185202 RepID=A0ACB9JPE0_9ASTR|nr:hypothetical protein L1987_09563 [Smallanthus sonchifolius]
MTEEFASYAPMPNGIETTVRGLQLCSDEDLGFRWTVTKAERGGRRRRRRRQLGFRRRKNRRQCSGVRARFRRASIEPGSEFW